MNWHGVGTVVTGGASFIGSHLTDALLSLGAKVEVIDNLSSGRLENLKDARDRIDLRILDLHSTSTSELAKLFTGKLVFHLAAEHGGRGYVDTHPVESMFNIQIDQNVFWAAWKGGAKKVIFTSSGCVYPPKLQREQDHVKLREADQRWLYSNPLPTDNEYGNAKLLSEAILKYLAEKHDFPTVSARLFSVYGPREVENQSIIAFIARAFIRQDPYVLWGDGSQLRNYTYVSDIVSGIISLAEQVNDGSVFNVGSDEAVTVRESAELICRLMSHEPKFVFDKSGPTGPHTRACDYSAIKSRVGWQPKVSFDEGVRSTVDWYVKSRDVNYVRENLDRLLYERGVAPEKDLLVQS